MSKPRSLQVLVVFDPRPFTNLVMLVDMKLSVFHIVIQKRDLYHMIHRNSFVVNLSKLVFI